MNRSPGRGADRAGPRRRPSPARGASYALALQCYSTGRIEAAVRYADAGQLLIASDRYQLPFGIEAALGVPYVVIGQPERCV